MTAGAARGLRSVAACAALVFVVRFCLSAMTGISSSDEVWFLQVVRRAAAGETLHRDVFFGSTPLAVWISLGAVRLFGAEILVVKAVFAAAATLATFAAVRVASLCGVRVPAWAVLLAGPFVPLPSADQIYGTLAIALLLVACAETLVATGLAVAQAAPSRTRLAEFGAGAAAGLAFASKPNVGALAALVAAVALIARSGPRAALRAGAAGVAAFLVVEAPIVFSGAFSDAASQVLLGKGAYLRTAGVSAAVPLASAAAEVVAPRTSGRLEALLDLAVVAFPFVALAAAFVAARRAAGDARVRVLTVTAFALAAFLFVVPRADLMHFRHTLVAFAALALVAAGPVLAASRAARAVAVAACLAFVTAEFRVTALSPLRGALGGYVTACPLPHLRGMPMHVAELRYLERSRRSMADDLASGRTLLLAPDAALWYLVTDATNPTRYDYPYASTFGPTGQREVAAEIAAGRIGPVWISNRLDPALQPTELLASVRDALPVATRCGGFEVRRAR